MANKIKYGLKNVYYSVLTMSGGAETYATPVAIPGAVNLSLSAEGGSDPFYADDTIYYQSVANNGYSGTLEIALMPESFKTDILGYTAGTDGAIIESADVEPAEFALLFEFNGDVEKTRHCMFRCKCTRPEVSSQTKEDSITPVTDTLNITAMPRISDNLVKASCKESDTCYANWFSAVYSA